MGDWGYFLVLIIFGFVCLAGGFGWGYEERKKEEAIKKERQRIDVKA